MPFYMGGTSVLIVVSVTMDTVTQIQSHLLAHQYEGHDQEIQAAGQPRPLGSCSAAPEEDRRSSVTAESGCRFRLSSRSHFSSKPFRNDGKGGGSRE